LATLNSLSGRGFCAHSWKLPSGSCTSTGGGGVAFAGYQNRQYQRLSGPPTGWMQIGAVVPVDEMARGAQWHWTARHPHLAFETDWTNTLYVSASRLVLPARGALPGAGFFNSMARERMLTAPGSSKPTVWSLPAWFMPTRGTSLTFHRNPSRWTADGDRVLLTSSARGQEFVVDVGANQEAVAWAAELIATGMTSS
jgi:hypothetical protein